MNLSRAIYLVHRWAGLASFVFLAVVALTGSVLVYGGPINRMTVPVLRRIEPTGQRKSFDDVVAAARAARPSDPPFTLQVGAADEPDQVIMRSWTYVVVNPYTGAVVGERRFARSVMGIASGLHGSLLAGRLGHWLVGIAGVICLLEAVTGVIRWWRYKTLWIRKGASARRAIFELHNVSGIFAVVFVVLLAVTGVMISFSGAFERVLRRLDHFGPAPAAAAPADTTPPTAVSVAATALAARPGTVVQVAYPMRDNGQWTVHIRPAGDHSIMGRVRVTLDSHGRVQRIRDGGPGQLGARILYWRDGIHGGWILGGVGEALAALAGLALALQAVTGFLVWWKPKLE